MLSNAPREWPNALRALAYGLDVAPVNDIALIVTHGFQDNGQSQGMLKDCPISFLALFQLQLVGGEWSSGALGFQPRACAPFEITIEPLQLGATSIELDQEGYLAAFDLRDNGYWKNSRSPLTS